MAAASEGEGGLIDIYTENARSKLKRLYPSFETQERDACLLTED